MSAAAQDTERDEETNTIDQNGAFQQDFQDYFNYNLESPNKVQVISFETSSQNAVAVDNDGDGNDSSGDDFDTYYEASKSRSASQLQHQHQLQQSSDQNLNVNIVEEHSHFGAEGAISRIQRISSCQSHVDEVTQEQTTEDQKFQTALNNLQVNCLQVHTGEILTHYNQPPPPIRRTTWDYKRQTDPNHQLASDQIQVLSMSNIMQQPNQQSCSLSERYMTGDDYQAVIHEEACEEDDLNNQSQSFQLQNNISSRAKTSSDLQQLEHLKQQQQFDEQPSQSRDSSAASIVFYQDNEEFNFKQYQSDRQQLSSDDHNQSDDKAKVAQLSQNIGSSDHQKLLETQHQEMLKEGKEGKDQNGITTTMDSLDSSDDWLDQFYKPTDNENQDCQSTTQNNNQEETQQPIVQTISFDSLEANQDLNSVLIVDHHNHHQQNPGHLPQFQNNQQQSEQQRIRRSFLVPKPSVSTCTVIAEGTPEDEADSILQRDLNSKLDCDLPLTTTFQEQELDIKSMAHTHDEHDDEAISQQLTNQCGDLLRQKSDEDGARNHSRANLVQSKSLIELKPNRQNLNQHHGPLNVLNLSPEHHYNSIRKKDKVQLSVNKLMTLSMQQPPPQQSRGGKSVSVNKANKSGRNNNTNTYRQSQPFAGGKASTSFISLPSLPSLTDINNSQGSPRNADSLSLLGKPDYCAGKFVRKIMNKPVMNKAKGKPLVVSKVNLTPSQNPKQQITYGRSRNSYTIGQAQTQPAVLEKSATVDDSSHVQSMLQLQQSVVLSGGENSNNSGFLGGFGKKSVASTKQKNHQNASNSTDTFIRSNVRKKLRIQRESSQEKVKQSQQIESVKKNYKTLDRIKFAHHSNNNLLLGTTPSSILAQQSMESTKNNNLASQLPAALNHNNNATRPAAKTRPTLLANIDLTQRSLQQSNPHPKEQKITEQRDECAVTPKNVAKKSIAISNDFLQKQQRSLRQSLHQIQHPNPDLSNQKDLTAFATASHQQPNNEYSALASHRNTKDDGNGNNHGCVSVEREHIPFVLPSLRSGSSVKQGQRQASQLSMQTLSENSIKQQRAPTNSQSRQELNPLMLASDNKANSHKNNTMMAHQQPTHNHYQSAQKLQRPGTNSTSNVQQSASSLTRGQNGGSGPQKFVSSKTSKLYLHKMHINSGKAANTGRRKLFLTGGTRNNASQLTNIQVAGANNNCEQESQAITQQLPQSDNSEWQTDQQANVRQHGTVATLGTIIETQDSSMVPSLMNTQENEAKFFHHGHIGANSNPSVKQVHQNYQPTSSQVFHNNSTSNSASAAATATMNNENNRHQQIDAGNAGNGRGADQVNKATSQFQTETTTGTVLSADNADSNNGPTQTETFPNRSSDVRARLQKQIQGQQKHLSESLATHISRTSINADQTRISASFGNLNQNNSHHTSNATSSALTQAQTSKFLAKHQKQQITGALALHQSHMTPMRNDNNKAKLSGAGGTQAIQSLTKNTEAHHSASQLMIPLLTGPNDTSILSANNASHQQMQRVQSLQQFKESQQHHQYSQQQFLPDKLNRANSHQTIQLGGTNTLHKAINPKTRQIKLQPLMQNTGRSQIITSGIAKRSQLRNIAGTQTQPAKSSTQVIRINSNKNNGGTATIPGKAVSTSLDADRKEVDRLQPFLDPSSETNQPISTISEVTMTHKDRSFIHKSQIILNNHQSNSIMLLSPRTMMTEGNDSHQPQPLEVDQTLNGEDLGGQNNNNNAEKIVGNDLRYVQKRNSLTADKRVVVGQPDRQLQTSTPQGFQKGDPSEKRDQKEHTMLLSGGTGCQVKDSPTK